MGITGKDFTLIAASKAAMRGATILKASDDKTRALNKNTLLAFSGEAGDTGPSPLPIHSLILSLLRQRSEANMRSSIRRVHPSKRPARLDAQRNRSFALGTGQLCPWRACVESAEQEALPGQLVDGWRRSAHGKTTSVLAGLPRSEGGGALCSSWIRTVRPMQYFLCSLSAKH